MDEKENRDEKMKKQAEEALQEARQPDGKSSGPPTRCPHCGNGTFEHHSILLNTRALTFFNLDFLNRAADAYSCRQCGLIQWFLQRPE
jgi:hypothetical protein